jgi:hypothetical protein
MYRHFVAGLPGSKNKKAKFGHKQFQKRQKLLMPSFQ